MAALCRELIKLYITFTRVSIRIITHFYFFYLHFILKTTAWWVTRFISKDTTVLVNDSKPLKKNALTEPTLLPTGYYTVGYQRLLFNGYEFEAIP